MNGDQLDMFVHKEENNKESQTHLNKNRKSFNKKCEQVFNWLLEGKELTVLQCANDGVASLPRRIADLKDKKVQISDRWEGNIKVYYMTPEQITIWKNKKDKPL